MRPLLAFVSMLLLSAMLAGLSAAGADVPGPWHLRNGNTVFVLDVTNPEWQSTGVVITSDFRVMIRVHGEANTAGWNSDASYPWVAWSGPGGLMGNPADPNHPLPGAPRWSVIGKLGEDGEPFYVGPGGMLGGPGATEGELFLGYNDWQFGDNFGYYVVYITNDVERESAGLGDSNPDVVNPLAVRASPNPMGRFARIDCVLPASGAVSLGIYDVAGRLVRILSDHATGPGPHSITWDGRDSSGHRAGNGTYYYVLTQGTMKSEGQVVLVR